MQMLLAYQRMWQAKSLFLLSYNIGSSTYK